MRMARSVVSRLRADGPRWLLTAAGQYLRARWALRGATAAGRVRLRGRLQLHNYGRTVIGDRVRLDGTIVPLDFTCGEEASLEIGDGTFINYGTSIGATERVSIGRNCDIGQYAIILDNDFHSTVEHTSPGVSRPVVIEDDVWIGARVAILPGAHIGRGAVIGTHSVVRGHIPPRTLAAGVPARVVRYLDAPEHTEAGAEPDTEAGAEPDTEAAAEGRLAPTIPN